MADALGTLAARSKELPGQQDFPHLVREQEEIIGAYVDTDLATESARLTALQVSNSLLFRQSVLLIRDRGHYLNL